MSDGDNWLVTIKKSNNNIALFYTISIPIPVNKTPYFRIEIQPESGLLYPGTELFRLII
jgi:hypothetical protein